MIILVTEAIDDQVHCLKILIYIPRLFEWEGRKEEMFNTYLSYFIITI